MSNTLLMYTQTLEPTIKGLQKFQHQLRRGQETFCLKKLSLLITRLTIFHGYRPFYFLNFFRPTLILERSSIHFFFFKNLNHVYIYAHTYNDIFLKRTSKQNPNPIGLERETFVTWQMYTIFFRDNYNMLLILQFEPFPP